MVQYSSEILDLFGGPELSELNTCGAKELPKQPEYISAAIWNHIVGQRFREASIHHLSLNFHKRANAADAAWTQGRNSLLRYVEGTHAAEHRLGAYISALSYFEQCVCCVQQANEIFNRMDHKLLGKTNCKLDYFIQNSNSVLKRVADLSNIVKHFNADEAEQSSAPIWITNFGLKSDIGAVTFDELYDELTALSAAARQTFVEFPKQAHARI